MISGIIAKGEFLLHNQGICITVRILLLKLCNFNIGDVKFSLKMRDFRNQMQTPKLYMMV